MNNSQSTLDITYMYQSKNKILFTTCILTESPGIVTIICFKAGLVFHMKLINYRLTYPTCVASSGVFVGGTDGRFLFRPLVTTSYSLETRLAFM